MHKTTDVVTTIINVYTAVYEATVQADKPVVMDKEISAASENTAPGHPCLLGTAESIASTQQKPRTAVKSLFVQSSSYNVPPTY